MLAKERKGSGNILFRRHLTVPSSLFSRAAEVEGAMHPLLATAAATTPRDRAAASATIESLLHIENSGQVADIIQNCVKHFRRSAIIFGAVGSYSFVYTTNRIAKCTKRIRVKIFKRQEPQARRGRFVQFIREPSIGLSCKFRLESSDHMIVRAGGYDP
jgi:hypothetical protein